MFKLKAHRLYQMVLPGILLFVPVSALAAGSLFLTQTGDGVFSLQGSGLKAPSGIQLTLNYDSTRLSNPTVVLGAAASGALFAPNTKGAGTVRLAFLKQPAMSGSGVYATITFVRTGDSPGTISMSGTVIDASGADLAATLSAGTFGKWTTDTASSGAAVTGDSSGASTNSSTTTGGGTSGGNQPVVVGGTVTLPTDDFAARERKEVPAQPAPQEHREIAAQTVPASEPAANPEEGAPGNGASPAKRETPKPVQSVLEKFRLHSGDKTVKNLTALFDGNPAAPFTQTPPIAISDGKSRVRVTIPKVAGDKSPNFAFSSARYVSLAQSGDGEWQVEVQPNLGVTRASISMLSDGVLQEFPLTVAPKVDLDLDRSGTVDEADFALFLKSRTESAPKFDLNRDGKRDYQDDYIFTANYLVATAGRNKKAAGR